MSGKLRDMLIEEARDQQAMQHPDGSVPAGHNGAYGDAETPARCTSHALVAFCKAHEATGEEAFKDAAERALAYLLDVLARSPGCIVMRNAKGKDQANGVLGPAFVIEAFDDARRILKSDAAREAALALLSRHSFDADKLCWRRVDADGTSIPPDMTFNHQLYFAATAAMFRADNAEIARQVDRFMAGWTLTLGTRADGRVVHHVGERPGIKRRLRNLIGLSDAPDPKLLAKEADYHLYNCYAFALLARSGVDVPSAAGPHWAGITSFADSSLVKGELDEAAWATSLRSGTETRVADHAVFHQRFGNSSAVALDHAADFLDLLRGSDRKATAYSPDPVTQKARAYRYWRLLEPA